MKNAKFYDKIDYNIDISCHMNRLYYYFLIFFYDWQASFKYGTYLYFLLNILLV